MRHPLQDALRSIRPRWAALRLPAWVALFLFVHPAAAQSALEYQVKAVFLLNFAKFVDWPSDAFVRPDSPVTICLLGTDPFERLLDGIVQGESANDRRLAVRRITAPPAPRVCQVVFMDPPPKDAALPPASLGRGVLTVGDGKNFVRDGGMIGFVIEDRRVRFDINEAAAARAGLKLSSKLLSVARTVQK